MTRAARRKSWDTIRLKVTLNGSPMTISEITDATRLHHEAVTYAVRSMVKEGLMVELPETRPTRSGPAKQFDVSRKKDRSAYGEAWAVRMRRNIREERVGHVLERWSHWVMRDRPQLGSEDPDRMLYLAIESAVNAMPVPHAAVLLNVHSLSVWIPRKNDIEECYREAIARVRRRLEPVYAISALAGVAVNEPEKPDGQEIRQGQGGRKEAALLRSSNNG